MTEEWRTILGGDYAVSDHGRVRRERSGKGTNAGRVLRPMLGAVGYPVVSLRVSGVRRTLYVHRLVAAAFIGPCPDGMEVNHKDGNKTNARALNLEYVSSSQNNQHAWDTGLRVASRAPANVGTDNGQAILTEHDVRAIRSAVAGGARRVLVAEKHGVSLSAVDLIVQRRRWRHVV